LIGSHHLGYELSVVVQRYRNLSRIFHHMVVGDDIPVFGDDDSRAEAHLFAWLCGTAFPKSEEEIERIDVLLLTNGLGFHVYNTIYGTFCCFREIGVSLCGGEVCQDHISVLIKRIGHRPNLL